MKTETFARRTFGGAALLAIISLMSLQSAIADKLVGVCGFDLKSLTFRGSDLQQAKCLLRPTLPAGHLGAELATLPAPLESVLGTSFHLDPLAFRAYLKSLQIGPDTLGGDIDTPLSRSAVGPTAKYFVIHDVSWSLCEDKDSLLKSSQPDAAWNRISRWENDGEAHLYITRDGKLVAPQGRTFAIPWTATKLEKEDKSRTKGRFLHTENVQLRTVAAKKGESTRFTEGKRKGECINDRIAEKPGLTQVQYERLALVYIAASHRAGQWLVPAYHLAVDDGVGEAHDDPQNFDLNDFGSKICGHLTALGRKECAP
ncbi:hypothetical protein [Pseudomonas baetica]|uniref:hypothetical protein n=1 Tax=Pseudomonas baetica TaxID=674054 RepID=UPI002405E458|nr:hypothetical protein [Pseudomonas baetica]MDF9779051.1 hypothetical protein [Pseudomonas baetica]